MPPPASEAAKVEKQLEKAAKAIIPLTTSPAGLSSAMVPVAPKKKKKQAMVVSRQALGTPKTKIPRQMMPADAENFRQALKKYGKHVSIYLASLLDPWRPLRAKIPDLTSYPSTAVQIKDNFNIKTNSVGRFAVCLRDGIYNFLSYSLDESARSLMTYNTGWEIGGTNGFWSGVPEQQPIRDAFSCYRPVSMGLRWTYQAEPVNAKGRIVAALWPASTPLPNSGNAITFDELTEFEGAQIFPAIEGGTALWRPYGLTSNDGYRPCKNGDYLSGFAATSTWDLDPQERVTAELAQLLHNNAIITPTILDAIYQQLIYFHLPTQSPMLIIIGEGLPVDTVALNFEAVLNIEAISDNRSFSLSQPDVRQIPFESEAGHSLHVVNQLPAAHAGGSEAHHANWLQNVESVATKVASGLKTAFNVAETIGSLLL